MSKATEERVERTLRRARREAREGRMDAAQDTAEWAAGILWEAQLNGEIVGAGWEALLDTERALGLRE